jgi:hypothetical protein
MDTSTFIEENIIVKNSLNNIVNGYILYNNSKFELIFIPYPYPLDYSQVYTVTIKWNVKDSSGNYLDGNRDNFQQKSSEDDYTWQFSTIPWELDASPPKIISIKPTEIDTDVTINPTITTIFSKDIDSDTLNPSTVFILDPNGQIVDSDIFYIPESKELRIDIEIDLEYNTRYTILITAEVRDLSGHGLDGNNNDKSEGSPIDNFYWSFKTKLADSQPGKEPSDDGYYLSILTIIGILIVLTLVIILGFYLKRNGGKQKFVIHDIFIIYNDGRLIAHQSFEKKSNIDEGSLGGMLTAIQNFINESFLDQDDEVLEEIKYGKLKILLVHGKEIYLAVICGGDLIPNKFQKDMRILLNLIEVKYGDVLTDWDGNMKEVRDIDELIRF